MSNRAINAGRSHARCDLECREPALTSGLGFQAIQKIATIQVSSGLINPGQNGVQCQANLVLLPGRED
jgi:hypothetical protein